MKNSKFIYRLLALVAVIAASLVSPQDASAKWSKACDSFTYDGIKVKVYDRREFIGHLVDSQGYTEMINETPYDARISWVCYGVTKKGSKLIKVDSGSFELPANKTSTPFYSYSAGHFNHTDFSKYVVSIEVIKDDDNSLDSVHNRLTSKPETELTQKDYADGISQMRYAYFYVMFPLTAEIMKDQKKGMSKEQIEKKYGKRYEELEDKMAKYRDIIEIVGEAQERDRLNSENKQALKALEDDIKGYLKQHPDMEAEFNMY